MAALVCSVLLWAGCTSGRPGDANTTGAEAEAASVDDDYAWPPVRPDDFPETLAELSEQVEWEDQLVLDAIELLREERKQSPPAVSVAEALEMRNDSPEANANILDALGRLAPPDGSGVDYDARITRHLRADVRSTNPLLQSSTAEFDVVGLIGFGLFSFDWNMTPFASSETVASWQTSKDRMYDKVVLRDDLVWSDGEPITAHDVVFSYKWILNRDVPIPAVRSGTDELVWIEAYDDHTLVYLHKQPAATNVWNLNFPVIPKHIYETTIPDDLTMTNSERHVELENNPVVGGPYRISSRVRGQEIVLERREDYYMHEGQQVRPKPYFKTIRFRVIEDSNTALLAVKAGEIEDLELTPEQWRTQTDGSDFYQRNTKATGREWTFFYFGWNIDTPYFSDRRVREAMSFAFDHQEMLDTLCYGLYEPCSGIFHPDAWMYPQTPTQPYEQDLDKAEDLLDAAGWIDHDGDGVRDKEINRRLVPFEFTVVCSNVPLRVQICSLLKESLDRIGVLCNVSPLEFTVLQDRTQNKNFHAFMGGWGTGADPDTSDNIWGTGEGRNYVSYSNPEVDRLFDEAKKEFDRQKRGELYGRIHELIYEDQPYTFLFHQSGFYAFNKELRGYMYSPRGPYHYSPGFSGMWRAID